jgi:hypothetical protein
MADYFDGGKFGAVVAIPFSRTNISRTNSTNAYLDLYAPGGTVTMQTMPHSGSVVGISIRATAGLSAGWMKCYAHKSGTEFADAGRPIPQLNTTAATTQASYATVHPGCMQFAAGDPLGLSVMSATDMEESSNNDVDALLWVQFDAA